MSYTIHALSFDADNCLFHAGYNPTWKEIKSGQCQQVIDKNKPLLDALKAQKSDFKETIVLVGSLRQSVEIDQYNANEHTTESIFTAIQTVAQYLGATLDKFLLTDVEANVAPGTSFDHAINHPSKKQNTCIDDQAKVALLYAQIHKLANQHPNENILFDFYDDRGLDSWGNGDDILEHLHAYFKQYPELLPSNVTLRLNHYEGEQATPYTDIKGTGFTDTNYQKTTQTIAAITRFSPNFMPVLTPERLRHRQPLLLNSNADCLPTHYSGSFTHLLTHTNRRFAELMHELKHPQNTPFDI